MGRVLLTGATGFLGSAIEPELRQMGLDVITVSRKPTNTSASNHLVGDLQDGSFVSRALAGVPRQQWVNNVYVGDVARAIAELARARPNRVDACWDRYIINTPATLDDFFKASAEALGAPGRPWVVPRLPLLSAATLCDIFGAVTRRPLPLTRGKAREMLNRQFFSIQKLKSRLPTFPYFGLAQGLANVSSAYRRKGLL